MSKSHHHWKGCGIPFGDASHILCIIYRHVYPGIDSKGLEKRKYCIYSQRIYDGLRTHMACRWLSKCCCLIPVKCAFRLFALAVHGRTYDRPVPGPNEGTCYYQSFESAHLSTFDCRGTSVLERATGSHRKDR